MRHLWTSENYMVALLPLLLGVGKQKVVNR